MTTVIAEATEQQQNKNNNNWKTADRTHTHTKIKNTTRRYHVITISYTIVQKWNSRVKDQKSRNYF